MLTAADMAMRTDLHTAIVTSSLAAWSTPRPSSAALTATVTGMWTRPARICLVEL